MTYNSGLTNWNFWKKRWENIRQQFETVHAKLEAVTHDVEGTKDRVSLQKDLEQARSRLNQLETQHALFEKQRQEIATINLRAAEATHQRLLSEWVADAVEQTMQALIGTSLHQTETSVLNCLENFQILQQRHQKLDLEGTRLMPDVNGRVFHALSGGEKVILYLGMKLAVSQLMPGADFIVLDNPTAHLDNIRRQQMQEFLLSLVPQKQVIVLTNDNIFADLLSLGKRVELK
jgi:exonuclease SbcC